jgi:vacuolar-type H+-ATPase subunit E/Vma4
VADYVTKADLDQAIEGVKTELKAELRQSTENILALIHQVAERIDTRFDEMSARHYTQSARLERHAALLQTGSRWSAKMNEWAEKIDKGFEDRDKIIANLTERLRKLEEHTGLTPPV